MEYVLATNLHHTEVSGGYHGLYNPLKDHSIIFIDTDTHNTLLKFKKSQRLEDYQELSSISQKLIEDKFLLPSDFDQSSVIKSYARKLPHTPRIVLMYMLLTDACNLQCGYCFERGNENLTIKKKNMSQQTAENSISFFSRMADKETKEGHKVIFYGGEPFINRKIFVYSVKKLRELEQKGQLKDLTMIVNTNGSLVDNSLAVFCADYKVNPAISIDGTKEIHDAARPGPFSSFDGAIRGYKTFKKHGVNPGISCTISAKNILNLEEITKFLVNELEPNGIGFNFLLDLKAGNNPLMVPIEEATKRLIATFEFLRTKGVYEERLMRRLEKIVSNKLHLKDCAGYGSQIVVGPDGSLGPCQVFLTSNEFILGNVNDNPPDPRQHPIFIEWNKRTAFELEGCENCSSIAICGGGCAYNAYVTKGSIWQKDERMCKHCDILLDWLIKDIWKRKNAQHNI